MTSSWQLPRSTPESQGISSTAILNFLTAAEQQTPDMHSVMLLRHGHVIAEGWWTPYTADTPHILFSLSKSFTSSAIGLAVAEGRLSVDDKVVSFFPEELPSEVSENLAAMRIRDLLAMSTGHDTDSTGALHAAEDGNWVRAFLAHPVVHKPGTHFVYNSGATYMLSAILQRVVGVTLLEYLQPRLLEPLGITEGTWETCPRGINVGGWGFKITTESIARFGQLYLQRGVWQGRRLIEESWIEAATSFQSDNSGGTTPVSDWQQGYGYQFWLCRHNAYRGDGAFGQFCIVMPEQDAVLAITSGVKDMQAVLDLVWEHLLPAFQSSPLVPNPVAWDALERKQASLALTPVQGAATSPIAAQVSGKRYRCEPNPLNISTIYVTFDGDGAVVELMNNYGPLAVDVGLNGWRFGQYVFDERGYQPSAVAGAWLSDDTFAVDICQYHTPFRALWRLQFEGDSVRFSPSLNVSFGPTDLPAPIIGRAE